MAVFKLTGLINVLCAAYAVFVFFMKSSLTCGYNGRCAKFNITLQEITERLARREKVPDDKVKTSYG